MRCSPSATESSAPKNKSRRADDLHIENLRLQVELERYKKWYYGPRADRLERPSELAQMLLKFAEELEQQADQPGRCFRQAEPEDRTAAGEAAQGAARSGQLRESSGHDARIRVERGENGPVRAAAWSAKRSAAEESWQIEYIPGHFERLQHVRKKYACENCEQAGREPADGSGGQGGDRRSKKAWLGRGCWPTS